MASIRINETDNTVVNPLIDPNDNIVFIPGNTVTGPIGVPTLCKSYEEFIMTFGDFAPDADDDEVGTSWEYAANILQAGEFYVLFERLAPEIEETIEIPAVAATSSIVREVSSTPVTIGTVTAVNAGVAGNALSYSVSTDNNKIVFNYFADGSTTPDATEELISDTTGMSDADKIAALVTKVGTGLTVGAVTLTIVDATNFLLSDIVQTNLANGADASSTTVTTPSAVKAAADIERVIEEQGTSTTIKIGTVTELYGGTFGNQLSYEISVYSTEIRFRLYRSIGNAYNRIEDIQLLNTTGLTNESQIKAALIAKIGAGLRTKYVEIKITDSVNFMLSNTNKIALTGGTDPADLLVAGAIPSVYSKLADTILYDVKFLTSANYYNTGSGVSAIDVVTPMKELAESRKDCTVFANIPIALDKANVQDYVQSLGSSSYVTYHAPWALATLQTGGAKWMSPSYIALVTLAKSIKMGYKIYQAPAGVNRASTGMVQRTEYEIGNATLDEWQNTKAPYVNPIMYLLKYGYVIFGQRTSYMVSGSQYDRSALQELTVRLTANEIKRKIRSICLGLTFEANNVRTWNSFRGQLIPYLKDMKEYGGLEAYKVVMDETTTTPEDINNNRIVGIVSVVIPRAAEDFVINFTLEPAGTTFDEEV